MSEKQLEFTIIVPLFNEEENIKRLEKSLKVAIKTLTCQTKVLFVNDGSTDNSQQMLESICSNEPMFSYIELEKNSGLSTALKAGIDYCDTPYIGYIDADLQTSPDEFNKLLPFRKKVALVTGVRLNRKDSFVKRISSRIANNIRRSITKDGVADTGCPLKILQLSYAQKISFFKGMHRFLPALIQLEGGKVEQVPVHHFPRVAGKAKYHLSNRLLIPLRDLFAVRWMMKRHIDYEIKKQG